MNNGEIVKNNKEIDIIGLFKKVLQHRKSISIFILVFAILGVVIALNTKKQYKTTVLLAPESTTSNMNGAIGSLGGLLGINIGGVSSDAIFPELYPNIFTSNSFLVQLFDVPVTMNDYETIKTYYSHLKNDYKPYFWEYPRIWLSELIKKLSSKKEIVTNGLNFFHLTKEEYAICEHMMSNIQCVVDQRTSLISITVTDIDEVVAACMADTLTSKLQQYITEYRTKKAVKDYEFIRNIYEQAKSDYLKAQEEYVRFDDANKNIVLSKQRSKLINLENEMQLRLSLYSEISQQMQIAYQRIQERTPVFSVIQPASVSLKPSGMSRKMIVILYSVFGFVIGSVWSLYLKDFIKDLREKRKANK